MEILVELAKAEVADEFTGMVYSKDALNRAVNRFEERIRLNDGIIGEYTTPVEEEAHHIDFLRASHVVKHIWMAGDVVVAKLKLIGKFSDMVEKAGVTFGGRMRDLMILKEGTQDEVVESVIITVDLRYEEIPVPEHTNADV